MAGVFSVGLANATGEQNFHTLLRRSLNVASHWQYQALMNSLHFISRQSLLINLEPCDRFLIKLCKP
jgi:hypothetical protein